MTRGQAIALLLVGACAGNFRTYGPDEAELELRAVEPGDPQVQREREPECSTALEAATTHDSLDRAAKICGRGAGIDWRRGVLWKQGGDYDAAVRAFVAELRGPAPAPVAGAHLLAALPHSKDRTQRAAKQRGRGFDPAGLAGLSLERTAMAMCGGRAVVFGRVACNRDPPVCTYRFHCEGGGRREIAVGSRELWFGTQ